MKDLRVKISKDEYPAIRHRILVNKESIRQVARELGVSRRLIDFIVHPEKLQQQKKLAKVRGWKKYYHAGKARESMRKYNLKKKGIIKNTNE